MRTSEAEGEQPSQCKCEDQMGCPPEVEVEPPRQCKCVSLSGSPVEWIRERVRTPEAECLMMDLPQCKCGSQEGSPDKRLREVVSVNACLGVDRLTNYLVQSKHVSQMGSPEEIKSWNSSFQASSQDRCIMDEDMERRDEVLHVDE